MNIDLNHLSLIMSAIALFITVATFVERLIKARVKISVEEMSYYHNTNGLRLSVIVANKSTLPISITRVQIMNDNGEFDVEFRPVVLTRSEYKNNGEILYTKTIENTAFPVNLSPLQAQAIHMSFNYDPTLLLAPDKALNLRISTNRRAKSLTLTLQNKELLRILQR